MPISKSEFGLHIVCNFGGQAPIGWGVLESKGRKSNTLSRSSAVAYNKRPAAYDNGKRRAGTRVPREETGDATSIKILQARSASECIFGTMLERAGGAPGLY
jgi:hypothetical protein